MSDELCDCCGNRVPCDCSTVQSAQFRRIAELEADFDNALTARDDALDAVKLIGEQRKRADCSKRDRAHPITRVLYLLGNGDISVGKACEYVRDYLLDGVQGPLVDGSVDDLPCDKTMREVLAELEAKLAPMQNTISGLATQSDKYVEQLKAMSDALVEERARLDNAKRILCNLIRVNGGSPLDEEAALAAIDAAGKGKMV